MRTLPLAILTFAACVSAFAEKRVIKPKEFPASPNFSHGILVDGTLYAAGQIGRDLKAGKVPEEFEAEVKACLENVGLILKEAGMSFGDVVSVQVYLTDMDLFQRMNAVYTTFFKDPRPARTTVGVAKLAGGARIEITVTARK